MKKVETEVFSEQPNSPVLRMHGRRFPGVLIQGDSLKNETAKKENSTETYDSAVELKDLLAGYISHYEEVLGANDFDLPYKK